MDPAAPKPIPNYMLEAISITIFMCSPTGLIAMWYAYQVSQRQIIGDLDGAWFASRKAKEWCMISVWVGAIIGILLAIILVYLLARFSPLLLHTLKNI